MPLRILLIEDEMLVSMMLEDMIVSLGHTVVGPLASVRDAEAALAGPRDFDIALLDLNLAGQSSLPLAEELRRRGVPLVFSTGYGSAMVAETFPDAAVLQKPFSMADLESTIAVAAGAVAAPT
jgi:DNA-binding response OmpR family regulator